MADQKKGKLNFLFFLLKWLLIVGIGLAFFPISARFLSKPAPTPQSQVSGEEVSQTAGPSPQSTPTTQSSNIESAKVTRVIDGDTIELEGGKRLRYIGMDTPEMNSGNPDCFAKEAYEKNRELVEGVEVRLEKDISETDRYERLLRYVYVGDTMVNEELVKQGYARVYTYPPDVKYRDKFVLSEQEARNNNLGLWSMCQSTPIPMPKASAKAVSTSQPISDTTGGSFVCDCSKSCTEITSCAEAQYQLNTCGCSRRDSDHDGIACDGAPLHCQK